MIIGISSFLGIADGNNWFDGDWSLRSEALL